jgi:hypothetical protein
MKLTSRSTGTATSWSETARCSSSNAERSSFLTFEVNQRAHHGVDAARAMVFGPNAHGRLGVRRRYDVRTPHDPSLGFGDPGTVPGARAPRRRYTGMGCRRSWSVARLAAARETTGPARDEPAGCGNCEDAAGGATWTGQHGCIDLAGSVRNAGSVGPARRSRASAPGRPPAPGRSRHRRHRGAPAVDGGQGPCVPAATAGAPRR